MCTPGSDDDVVIARVVRARGIRGEVACDVETDFPERFRELKVVTVQLKDGSKRSLVLQSHWFHKDRVILKFEGIDTMNDAEKIVGALLLISDSERPLEQDQFFEYAIVGSEAITTEGRTLGKVVDLIRTGGTDVLVISSSDGREYMVPFADEICTDVDVSAGRITINAPEGLLDL